MIIPVSNTPRAYAWGAHDLIADLQGREPSGEPEAEVWFGDHPGGPAVVQDGSGATLDAWLSARETDPLPYLLKLLAAGAPLSIQAHPSRAQAVEGFGREHADGIAVDAPERLYRDDNHKPEVIVALSDTFEAFAGIRPLAETALVLAEVGGAGADAIAARLDDRGPADVVGWLLSGAAADAVADLLRALDAHPGPAHSAVGALRRVAAHHPGDPGVAVALLMNHVVLRRGEALYVPAGALHAYLGGLGVEIMAASDNVLRGGLTRKHVDVPELLRVLDAVPAPPFRLDPVPDGPGVSRFAPPIPDFALLRVDVAAGPETRLAVDGTVIVLVTDGAIRVGDVLLRAGEAAVVVDESAVVLRGVGEAFVATRGRPRDTPMRAQ